MSEKNDKIFMRYLWWLATRDAEFLRRFSGIIDPGTFESPEQVWLLDQSLKYYAKYHEVIPIEALGIEVRKKKDTSKFDKETVIELYDEATEPTGSMREFVFDYADEFFRKRLSLELVGDFADTVSEGNLHEAMEILNDATRRLNQSTEEDDGVKVSITDDVRSTIMRIVTALGDDGQSVTTGVQLAGRLPARVAAAPGNSAWSWPLRATASRRCWFILPVLRGVTTGKSCTSRSR